MEENEEALRTKTGAGGKRERRGRAVPKPLALAGCQDCCALSQLRWEGSSSPALAPRRL